MSMFSVITSDGHIVCRSRLYEVAIAYLTPLTILLENGSPYAA